MTDYLEELLEQQESDEEDGTLDWRKGTVHAWERQAWEQMAADGVIQQQQRPEGGIVTYRHRRPEGGVVMHRKKQLEVSAVTYRQDEPAEEVVPHRNEAPGENDMHTLVQAAAEEVWQKRAGKLPLVGQMTQLHRAVIQGREHRGSGHASVQAVMQPEMTDVWHAGALSVRRAADYAAAVDAAFQRDARRYDGPLGLL